MHLATQVLVMLGVFMPSLQVVAFDPSTQACDPGADAFSTGSLNIIECPLTTEPSPILNSWTKFKCGKRGFLNYHQSDNKVAVIGTGLMSGQFTIHGACFDGPKQVAHIDLYTPAKQGSPYRHQFAGLNRPCDLKKGLKLKVWSYMLDEAGISVCGHNPIN